MKYLNKKGQGAMEYLMTYGWAIMIVLIAGIVLWQLGIFNIGGTAKIFKGFGAVKPLSWGIPAPTTGDGVITLVNGEGVKIIPVNCTLDSLTGETSVTVCQQKKKKTCKEKHQQIYVTFLGCEVVNTGYIPAGGEFKLIFHNCTANCSDETAGDPYEVLLSINYNKSIGIITEPHLTEGTLKGTFE